jgi:hypothetical protein
MHKKKNSPLQILLGLFCIKKAVKNIKKIKESGLSYCDHNHIIWQETGTEGHVRGNLVSG